MPDMDKFKQASTKAFDKVKDGTKDALDDTKKRAKAVFAKTKDGTKDVISDTKKVLDKAKDKHDK
ncbi:hypothetical protein M3M39_07440 [Fructilactobacillus hinvesii]|uniref:Antitoxin n=1 Tax=Fructilactobacillus hinvesii TaxID=2940300 RepID=A0ABY5BTL0_9LACO|nr:hypothetical protein [Fructilactobacillus hinvesii]USS87911.1 hypothetical protein M3M39_07440 [Fructilactobacillus hinvesii]